MAEESKSSGSEVSKSINEYLSFITYGSRFECNNYDDLMRIIKTRKSEGGLGSSVENNKRFTEDEEKNNYGYSFMERHSDLTQHCIRTIIHNSLSHPIKIADIGSGFGLHIINLIYILTNEINRIKSELGDFKIEFELYDIFDNNIEALKILKKIYQNDPKLNYITINVNKIDITSENIIEKKYDCDYVFIYNVLHFINKEKWNLCFENINNMLKNDGFLYIGVDAHLAVLRQFPIPDRNFIISAFTISEKGKGINSGQIYPNLTLGLLSTEDNLGEKMPYEKIIENDVGSVILSTEFSRTLGKRSDTFKSSPEQMETNKLLMRNKAIKILEELKNGSKSLSLNGYSFSNSGVLKKAIKEKARPEFFWRLRGILEVNDSNDVGICYQKKEIRICESDLCTNDGKLKCSRCKNAYYCSGECQKKSWGKHKNDCATKKSSDGKLSKRRSKRRTSKRTSRKTTSRRRQRSKRRTTSRRIRSKRAKSRRA